MQQNKDVPKGYKLSSLGVIPEEWEVKKIGEILTEGKLGGNYENTEAHSGIPIMKMGNIQRGFIDLEKIQYFPENEHYNKEDILKMHDLLFNTRNTLDLVGKVAIWRNELPFALYNSNLMKMTFDPKAVWSNIFMNYAFNSYDGIKQLKDIATGTTSVAAIYGKDLKKIKVLLPPLREQEHIAKILSTWDEAIEKQNKIVEKLELRKRALMQQLLTGKKRLDGFSDKWKLVRIKEVFKEIKEANDGHAHSIMTISSKMGLISQQDKFDRVIAGDSLKKYTLIKKNDFAYNKGNSKTYLMGCVFQLLTNDSALVPFVYICFRPTDKVYSSFYKHWFINHGLDQQLNRIITSGARGDGLLNVNNNDFFEMKIPFPSFKEQKAIANILTNADNEISLAKSKLNSLNKQKKGLMQVLLTGKIRVKI